MPRLLSDKPCQVTFHDHISASELTLYFDMPSTEDRVAYSNAMFSRRGNKVESNMGETRLKYGAKILRGFKDGAFETDKGPISSSGESPRFDPEWKTFVRKYAQDVVQMLAIHVFEASVSKSVPDAEEVDKEITEDPL